MRKKRARKTTGRVKKNTKSTAGKEKNISRRYELKGLALFTLGVLSLCGLMNFNVGFVGVHVATGLQYLFGVGAYVATFLFLLIGLQYMTKHHGIIYSTKFFGIMGLLLSLLTIYHHLATPMGEEVLPDSLLKGGGLVGGLVLFVVRKCFGYDGGIIVLGAATIGMILLSTTWSLGRGIMQTKKGTEKGLEVAKDTLSSTYEKAVEVEQAVCSGVKERVRASFYNQDDDEWFNDQPLGKTAALTPKPAEVRQQEIVEPAEAVKPVETVKPIKQEEQAQPVPSFTIEYSRDGEEDETNLQSDLPVQEDIPAAVDDIPLPGEEGLLPVKEEGQPVSPVAEGEQTGLQEAAGNNAAGTASAEYIMPDVKKILQKKAKVLNSELEQEIADNAQKLAQTLENFKVKATIINACHGPAVTRYELEPAPGVKVSKIVNLADDIALSLAAASIRIEPIPGKAAIGIEVPNKVLESVQLREVLDDKAFTAAKSKLTVGLGMDISGQAICADLGKMPHMLVAGATGSGKSVCINTLITSILFKAKPDEVKFILIDPKMVELSNYNGIPHLMVPVVTDSQKAASVLNWAVQEMEKRYAKFAKNGVRDMARYNNLKPEDKMPAVVIIIDELADLMMVAPHDVEDAICRLAQKARAAGIHLVLATQRPSVDVITGIIKANIPSRISFAVSSQIDSRTILDASGAEKLLGKGDMLFYPVGAAKPRRVQGAFVSDQEVENLLDFIRQQGQEAEPNEEIINFTEKEAQEKLEALSPKPKNKTDELLEEAVSVVMATGQASTSNIQRRFRIGYTRAARLIDTMEELKIIGPSKGSKPRDILMNAADAVSAVKKAQ